MKWTLEKLKEEALKYETRLEFNKNSNAAYQAAQKRKLLDSICTHMKRTVLYGEESSNFRWTDKMLSEEAAKWGTKTDFLKNNPRAYHAACHRGLLETICTHMNRPEYKGRENHPGYKWTKEKIIQEALKYKTRNEFSGKSGGAYHAANSTGILDEVCKHMATGLNSSLQEKELFNIIKAIYPKTQKIFDSKVKIEGKPHIKGFELDIYVPELRKAIEFDGKYHHSFDGLKRARPSWNDEDLHNYHQLKDSWFISKNIKILHIQGQDWKDNKQACIDKCLEFLNQS